MISFPSIANRHSVLCTLASAFAVVLVASGAARGAEVAPQLSLAGGILAGSFSAPSLGEANGDDFACFVASQDAAGRFSCSSASSGEISGQVVGVTDNFGVVVGHKIRMTRQASSTTESFAGAIARTGAAAPYLWMAGTLERTTRTRECGARNRCITVTRKVGPLPFTAEMFSPQG